jgi:hypothetical protein
MRNWLGYNMARWMGRYASRTKYFELFLNTVSSLCPTIGCHIGWLWTGVYVYYGCGSAIWQRDRVMWSCAGPSHVYRASSAGRGHLQVLPARSPL